MKLRNQILTLSIPTIIGAFSLYYIFTVWDAPWEVKNYSIGLTIGIFVCILFLIFKDFKVNNSTISQNVSEGSIEEKPQKSKLRVIMPLIFLFISSIYFIGYYLSTIIFLIITPWLLGYKRKKTIFLSTLIITSMTYFLFNLFLHVRLPEGLFFS